MCSIQKPVVSFRLLSALEDRLSLMGTLADSKRCSVLPHQNLTHDVIGVSDSVDTKKSITRVASNMTDVVETKDDAALHEQLK